MKVFFHPLALKNFDLKNSQSKPFLNFLSLSLMLIFFFTLTIFSSQPVRADVISLNSGGSNEIAVTSDRYIEGFFFAQFICGDGIKEGGEQCDDGNAANGDGCSSTCTTEAEEEEGGGGEGGGGGGGGGGIGAPSANIVVDPSEFNIDVQVSTNVERTIRVTNLGTAAATVSVSQQGLDTNVILGNTELTVQPGQTQELQVIFVASDEPGIITGTITIGGKLVLVALNVKTQLLLFDSNIVVLNENYEVPQGDQLRTLVTLIPLGDPARLDVTLNFVIKDFRNKAFLTKSETFLVEEQVELQRNFDTGTLPIGNYVIGLELIYPNGVAPSSASFKVIEKPTITILGRIVLFLLILILIILIIIIIILIIRRLKERKENQIAEQR